MPLSSGARLGPYEIQAAIGAGGMGEVYKARDTRLDRTVAIKILPAELSADPDRRVRFEREARAIAALSHPHICTLHDIGTHDGTTYLVMEYLPGQTLADRLQKGRLPPDQALTVATEIADALAAAHRQGIIHRDLKPGNVMLTTTGAKLLDFGLAKLAGHGAEPAVAQLTSAATRSAPLTADGTIVGTLQYMAPEQVEGKPADARTDLWALGAILYEMLTGTRAFEGTSAASLIGNIMNAEPASLSTLQPVTPPAVDRLVRQCLAKAPEDRPDTAHDVANDLRWLRESSGLAALTQDRPRRGRWWALGWTALVGLVGALFGAAALVAALFGAGLIPGRRVLPGPAVLRFSMTVPGRAAFPRVSPDGTTLAFLRSDGTHTQIWLRRFDAEEARPLPGTDGATSPSWSPDSRFLLFFAAGQLRKIQVAGGSPVTVCDVAPSGEGADWSPDDIVVFASDGAAGLMKVPAAGGLPELVTHIAAGETQHFQPAFLPDRQHFLFWASTSGGGRAFVGSLTSPEVTPLPDVTSPAIYAAGALLFGSGRAVMRLPFDPERLRVTGPAVPVLENVAQVDTSPGRWLDVSVSSTGLLAYIRAKAVLSRFAWVDRRSCAVTPLPLLASDDGDPSLSPNGRQLAFVRRDATGQNVYVYDLERETLQKRTFEGEHWAPIWTPDGRNLTFTRGPAWRGPLVQMPADGTGQAVELVNPGKRGSLQVANSWSRDGRLLSMQVDGDIFVRDASGVVHPAVATPAPFEREGRLDPTGRWLVYRSNEDGNDEVFVQSYPPGDGKWRISAGDGGQPMWRADGRELFYLSRDRMMAVPVDAGAAFTFGTPQVVCKMPLSERNVGDPSRYAVDRSGQRFLVLTTAADDAGPRQTEIELVLNWFEELKAKVPAGGAK